MKKKKSVLRFTINSPVGTSCCDVRERRPRHSKVSIAADTYSIYL
ncbi:MAG TPA: hypothetical protein VGI03_03280 [Verrucomicrobiae bacterium]